MNSLGTGDIDTWSGCVCDLDLAASALQLQEAQDDSLRLHAPVTDSYGGAIKALSLEYRICRRYMELFGLVVR